jgi:putative transcriptional regulator
MSFYTSASSLPPEYLLDYATGAAPEPVALAVATYLELNPHLQGSYHQLNALGGNLIEQTLPVDLTSTGLASVLARLENEQQERFQLANPVAAASRVPSTLQPYVGSDWDNLRWKSWMSGVEEYVIDTSRYGYRTSLLRISPGKAMPQHTHAGDELTVVLDGAYTDEAGLFGRGAIEIADSSVSHRPMADAVHGCVCLAVLSAPVQLTGMLGWVVNPFIHH